MFASLVIAYQESLLLGIQHIPAKVVRMFEAGRQDVELLTCSPSQEVTRAVRRPEVALAYSP
jgi:hypothetical protein